MVREYIISKNIVKLNDLQEFTLKFVTAKKQAYWKKRNAKRGKSMKRKIGWMRKTGGVLLAVAAASFMALIVRIVENVFQKALDMKNELDLTI